MSPIHVGGTRHVHLFSLSNTMTVVPLSMREQNAATYATEAVSLSLARTSIGFFSTSRNVLRSSHRILRSSTTSKSNTQISLERISRSSAHARCCPRQALGPSLNGWTTWRRSWKKGDSWSVRLSESQRSGTNDVAEWKYAGSRFIVYACIETGVWASPNVTVSQGYNGDAKVRDSKREKQR